MEFPRFYFGGDYNPDQWPEEIWLEDVKLMQEAGVNLVSLGIFSWAKLEPQPGTFDFSWLDRIMDLLHSHGVAVNLATPTASPPAWMIKRHPEMLPVTSGGKTLWHGSRRHYCPHHAGYHQYAKRIAGALAERYKNHPALVMWHVDNEYGCHISECYCQNSALAFRDWLKEQYGSLEHLNFAWGTAFWSQQIGDWEEIMPPLNTPAFKNPTQELDWARFSSDSWLVCYKEQKEVLREITPNIPITTNFMGFHKGVDYFKFAQHEDVVSNDSYPDTYQTDWMAQSGMVCDLMRSLGKGAPWILMEQAASHVNWRQRNAVKEPGIMRLGSMQAIARGANGIMFFQWRQSQAGVEKHHSGMVPHVGTASRVWQEIKSLGHELPRLKSLLDSEVVSDVAILMDWNNWWALELESKPSNDLKLIPNIYTFYKHLFDRHIAVDIVHPETDLSRYKLVVAPNLYLMNGPSTANLNTYVQNGGRLLMTYFSGIVDENEHILLGGYPAGLKRMLGLVVEEFVPYPVNGNNTIITNDGQCFGNHFWADVIHLHGAEEMATYNSDYYAGSPAITRHVYGKGEAYYLSTELDAAGNQWLLDTILNNAGIWNELSGIPVGVDAVKRLSANKEWLFFLNHQDKDVDLPLDVNGTDLLTGEMIRGTIHLNPCGVVVLEQARR